MLNRIRTFIPALIMFTSCAFDTHLRTGVDFNIFRIDIDTLANINISKPCPLPHLTAEVRQPIDNALDFGIAGSYIPIFIGNQSHHALKISMHSYLKKNHHNAVGLGLHIHHVPLNSIDPSLLGYLNNLSVGLSLQGTLSKNLYTHFEVRQDLTPKDLHFWESYLASQNQLYALAPSLISFRYFSSSISLGYILPTDL